MAYPQIVPVGSTGWVFRHEDPAGRPIVYAVAVWAMRDDGNVVGLISLGGTDENRLFEVPPVKGRYLRDDELTDEERAALLRR